MSSVQVSPDNAACEGRDETPGVLSDGRCHTVQPFPTFSEIYVGALKALRSNILSEAS
jgi:hypothetical protein